MATEDSNMVQGLSIVGRWILVACLYLVIVVLTDVLTSLDAFDIHIFAVALTALIVFLWRRLSRKFGL